jgi:N-acetylglutamate synthase-like GNAT family acetyltransferase
MHAVSLESRRAAAEDLESLQELWSASELPADELAGFLGEFQVVTDPDGRVLHAIGLLVEDDQGLLHSEALAPGSSHDPDSCRSTAWKRLRIIARNQGVRRIWTREDAAYWSTCGFQPVAASDLPEPLPSFATREDGWWLFRHPEPSQAAQMIQQEMALWQTQREQEAEGFRNRLATFRVVAWGLVLVVAVLTVVFMALVKTQLLPMRR